MQNETMLYTVKEVSEILKTNTSFVYKLINEGNLPAIKIGSIKVRKQTLEAFVARMEEQVN